jgi:hypothetical protein
MRFIYGWSLKLLIFSFLFLVFAPTLYMSTDPQLSTVLGLAWDAGAVTTGPVTVPLLLALGVGISAAARPARRELREQTCNHQLYRSQCMFGDAN